MNTIIRVACAVNKVKVADPEYSYSKVNEILDEFKENPSDIIVFPNLALTSPSCGFLFENEALIDSCTEAIENICISTQESNSYILVGTPIRDNGNIVPDIAVINRGKIIGYVKGQKDRMNFLGESYSDKMLSDDTVFSIGSLKFCILSCDPLDITDRIKEVASTGCDLVVIPSYSPVIAGYQKSVKKILESVSKTYGIGVAFVNGGVGDTTSPYIYRAFSCIYECGKLFERKDI